MSAIRSSRIARLGVVGLLLYALTTPAPALADPSPDNNSAPSPAARAEQDFRWSVAPSNENGELGRSYFVHDVKPQWRDRIPAVTHVDGTARIQTVDRHDDPLLADMLTAFERRTGLPTVVNTSLNTAGRPMVDDPRDALECFGSAPVDLLAIGPFAVRRKGWAP